jgi:DNA-binding response OmpR family regulator
MKILVLEENEIITNIYKKIFAKKEILAEFVNNESKFLEKVEENFDFFILENPNSSDISYDKIQDLQNSEKFIYLSSYIQKNEDVSHISKEVRDIIEKPFAMVSLLSKLDFISMKKAVVI